LNGIVQWMNFVTPAEKKSVDCPIDAINATRYYVKMSIALYSINVQTHHITYHISMRKAVNRTENNLESLK
jgi:hypothetical protein